MWSGFTGCWLLWLSFPSYFSTSFSCLSPPLPHLYLLLVSSFPLSSYLFICLIFVFLSIFFWTFWHLLELILFLKVLNIAHLALHSWCISSYPQFLSSSSFSYFFFLSYINSFLFPHSFKCHFFFSVLLFLYFLSQFSIFVSPPLSSFLCSVFFLSSPFFFQALCLPVLPSCFISVFLPLSTCLSLPAYSLLPFCFCACSFSILCREHSSDANYIDWGKGERVGGKGEEEGDLEDLCTHKYLQSLWWGEWIRGLGRGGRGGREEMDDERGWELGGRGQREIGGERIRLRV